MGVGVWGWMCGCGCPRRWAREMFAAVIICINNVTECIVYMFRAMIL